MKALIRGGAALTAVIIALSSHAHGVGEEMAEAANNWLASLTPEQKAKATFEMKEDERLNWHFIPRERKGLPIKEMASEQRALAQALLSTGLSHRGYFKARTIMSLEQILKDMEKGKGPLRDPDRYFFSIFGKPVDHGNWGWRVEGHHLSLNFTIAGDEVAVAPNFMGSNPAEVREGPRKGLRVLGVEEDLARKLVKSLNEEQRKMALYTNKAPSEIITGADRKAHVLDPKGVSMKELSSEQRQMLLDVIQEYVDRARGEIAAKEFEEIKNTAPEKVHFAWAGSMERGEGHYYRVQGPEFLIEYDNTQNNANHVHAVWRDLKNDFGEDILRKHYDESHRK